MKRRILLVTLILACAAPAEAVDYPTQVTFLVPYTIANYPIAPQGNDGPYYVTCRITRGSSVLGVGIEPLNNPATAGGVRNAKATAVVVVPLQQVAHSLDQYSCSFEVVGATGFTKGYKPQTSILQVSGALP
jgi:hypothetical protein